MTRSSRVAKGSSLRTGVTARDSSRSKSRRSEVVVGERLEAVLDAPAAPTEVAVARNVQWRARIRTSHQELSSQCPSSSSNSYVTAMRTGFLPASGSAPGAIVRGERAVRSECAVRRHAGSLVVDGPLRARRTPRADGWAPEAHLKVADPSVRRRRTLAVAAPSVRNRATTIVPITSRLRASPPEPAPKGPTVENHESGRRSTRCRYPHVPPDARTCRVRPDQAQREAPTPQTSGRGRSRGRRERLLANWRGTRRHLIAGPNASGGRPRPLRRRRRAPARRGRLPAPSA